jgi:uncharacterized phage-like protein YoqJ
MTYKIGITGHRPHKFTNAVTAQKACENVTLDFTARHGNVLFNLGGCTGADSWVASACIAHAIPFNLYLPFPAEIQAKYWNDQDGLFLQTQLGLAKAVDVAQNHFSNSAYHVRDRKIVDNSDILICFLEDFNSGTYSTVKYALSRNKLVFNGLTNTFLDK